MSSANLLNWKTRALKYINLSETTGKRVESIASKYEEWKSKAGTLKAAPPKSPEEANSQAEELAGIEKDAFDSQRELALINSQEATSLSGKIGLFLGVVGMLRKRAIGAGARIAPPEKNVGQIPQPPPVPPSPTRSPEGEMRSAPQGQEVVKGTDPKTVGSSREEEIVTEVEKGLERIGEEFKQVDGKSPRDKLVRLGWVHEKIKAQRKTLGDASGKKATELTGALNELESKVATARQKAVTDAKAAILDHVEQWETTLKLPKCGKDKPNEQIATVEEIAAGIAAAKADLEAMGLPGSELKMIVGLLVPVKQKTAERRREWQDALPKRQGTKDPEPKKLDAVEAPKLNLGVAECKQMIKACGNQWNNVKPRYKAAPDTMWQLWAYRKEVVDGAIDDLKKLYKFESMAVGSTNLESDYDIAVISHGTHPKDGKVVYDFEIVDAFNTAFVADYGVQPGTLFDTNLYASAKPATDAKTKETPVTETQKAMTAMAAGGQDVGALVKQRRYMSWEEYDAYAKKVVEGVRKTGGNELAEATLKQFEQADDLYQISLFTLLEKTKALLKSDIAVNSGERSVVDEDVSKQSEELLKELDVLEKKIASAGGVGGQKELIAALEEIEHKHSDLFMRASNSTYVESVKGVRDLETRAQELEAKSPRDEREELELQGLPAKIKTLATDAVCYANEAYHSEGPMKHIVESTQAIKTKVEKDFPGDKVKQKEEYERQRKEALEAMSLNQFLQSFNEQLGDFLKDLKHYADKPFPGMGFYRSSKYLDRLLDAMILIKDRAPDVDVTVPNASPPDPAGLKTKVAAGLLTARKGELAFKDSGDKEMEGDALQQEVEAYAIEQIKGMFGVTSLGALGALFLGVASRINSELRAKIIAAETMAKKGSDKAYYTDKAKT